MGFCYANFNCCYILKAPISFSVRNTHCWCLDSGCYDWNKNDFLNSCFLSGQLSGITSSNCLVDRVLGGSENFTRTPTYSLWLSHSTFTTVRRSSHSNTSRLYSENWYPFYYQISVLVWAVSKWELFRKKENHSV